MHVLLISSHQLRLNAVLYRTAYRPVPLQEYILSGHELLKPDGSKAGERFTKVYKSNLYSNSLRGKLHVGWITVPVGVRGGKHNILVQSHGSRMT